MRHPLNWILRVGVPKADRAAILGDLDEEYRARVRPARGWLRAQAWYLGELIAASVCATKERLMATPEPAVDRPTSASNPIRRLFAGRDVRHALRRWRRRPGFATTAIVTLALGIGATTAIFSVVDAVLLKPPSWPDHDRLVAIHAVFPDRRANPAAATTWNRGTVSYPSWDALRLDPLFRDVAVWRTRALDTTFGDARTEVVTTMDASSNFLQLVGVRVIQGRLFSDIEDKRNSDSVLVTHEAWQRRLGGRADVIGLGVPLGSASSGGRYPKTIVGVVEPGFAFAGTTPEFLLPVGISAETGRTYRSGALRVIASMAPGASIEAADTAARTIVGGIETSEPTSARVLSLADDLYGHAKRPLTLLFGGAALLLLVACANVAGLLIGEARARRHEIAVRAALGSGRLRVMRQLAIEHALLAVAGSMAGVAIAYWLVHLFVGTAPAGLPRIDGVQLDTRAVLFAFSAGALTFLVFGIAPAFTLARTPAAAVLAEGGRDGASSRTLGQRLIVAAEMALALVLVVGASLLGETLYRAMAQPLGFNPAGLALVSFQTTELPGPRTPRLGPRGSQTPEEANRILQQVEENMSMGWWLHLSAGIDRVAALPGVESVGASAGAPFLPGRRSVTVGLPGQPGTSAISVRFESVSDRYFAAMGIPILRGRNLENSDRRVTRFLTQRGAPFPAQPVVVSEAIERRLFNGAAVGQRLTSGAGPSTATYDIVGVVPDVRFQKDVATELPTVYPLAQGYRTLGTLLVRTNGDPRSLLPAIRDELRTFDPTMVVTSTTTMDDLLATAVAEERFRALLAALFGGTALVLAAVGLYGLAARRVADRRREIAVRVALGARPRDVRGLVMQDALRTVTIGLVLGLPAAYLASRVTEAFLFGVSATAPHIFASAALVLALAAFVATVLPARRAAAIDPMVVLKE